MWLSTPKFSVYGYGTNGRIVVKRSVFPIQQALWDEHKLPNQKQHRRLTDSARHLESRCPRIQALVTLPMSGPVVESLKPRTAGQVGRFALSKIKLACVLNKW